MIHGILALFGYCLSCLLLWQAPNPQQKNPADDFVADRLIFVIDKDLSDKSPVLTEFKNRTGALTILPLYSDFIYLAALPKNSSVRSLATTARTIAHMQHVHPDMHIYAAVIPDDPKYSGQWNYPKIEAPAAWDLRTDASQIIVAVLDTGVDYNHPDLAANIWINAKEIAGNGIDDDQNGYVDDVNGWDYVGADKTPLDGDGHGTHVAGTIGAVSNNSYSVAGICWQVKIMPLRVLGSSLSGEISNAIAALDYAVKQGVSVANASWGSDLYSSSDVDALKTAIQDAGDHDLLFVCAAGNQARDVGLNPFYPSSFNLPMQLSVMATDENDKKAAFSNWNIFRVHLAAPGTNIPSVRNGGGSNPVILSGTSMASPHVAGAAALVKAHCPSLSMSEVRTILMDSVDKLNLNVVSGGRLNLRAALQACNISRDIVWVDYRFHGDGSQANPFGTIIEAVNTVKNNGTIMVQTGAYPEIFTTNKAFSIQAQGGPIIIGK